MQYQLYDILYQWLSNVPPATYYGPIFQLDVTPLDQGAQFGDNTYSYFAAEETFAPPTPEDTNFGTYAIIAYTPLGIDSSTFTYNSTPDNFTETVKSFRDATVSLNIYSVDQTAEDTINQLLLSASSQSVKDLFNASGFAMKYYSMPRDLSSVISGRYVKRFQSDLTIGVIANYSNIINRIAQAPFVGDISNNNINFTVDT